MEPQKGKWFTVEALDPILKLVHEKKQHAETWYFEYSRCRREVDMEQAHGGDVGTSEFCHVFLEIKHTCTIVVDRH